MSLGNQPTIGRFAPSPTGPLHLGSLYTALAGFLQARACSGRWLLRIDDLDTPRNVKGAADAILKTLEVFNLDWDGEVYYQSRHIDIYHDVIDELRWRQLVYPCICSRKTLATLVSHSSRPGVYPGFCRHRLSLPDGPYALRVKTDERIVSFADELQGQVNHRLAERDGDFIVKRKDGIIAYQFAVVVDDKLQQVNHVVRGFDLLQETPKQIYLQQLLSYATPAYMHVPIIVDEQGCKLSKQTFATAVDLGTPNRVIFELLTLLKQQPPSELKHASIPELLAWAVLHWNPELLKETATINENQV